MSCDPLQLADTYIAQLKEIGAQVERVYARIPGTLADLTQCLVFGTAERAGGVLDPDVLREYDLDSLERRIEDIFDSVERGLDSVGAEITAHGDSENVDFVAATSGLWISQDPAGTFYGLTAARTEGANEDVDELAILIEAGRAASTEARLAIDALSGPEGQSLLEAARLWTEEICPEVDLIEAELRALSDGIGRTQDLSGSSCDTQTLEERILALMARVPNVGLDRVINAVEAVRKMQETITDLQPIRERLNAVQTDLPDYEAQMEAGGFSTQTEQRLPRALADQFSEICEQIYALALKDRWAEMISLGPPLREIGAIAVTTLRQSPEWRVEQIRNHDAREDYGTWMDTLRGAQGPDVDEDTLMEGIIGDLPASIIDLSNDILFGINDYEQYLTDLEAYGQVIQTGALEFLGAVEQTLDIACTGALRVLLFELGYDELEKIYAKGLFGDLPGAVYQLATQTGRLIQCIGDVLNSPARLVNLTGEQKLALERANDTLRTMEEIDHFVANVAREANNWGRNPPVATINEVAAVLERDLKGGLRNLGLVDREIPETKAAPDGFVQWTGANEDGLPEGVFLDANGYLQAHPGADLPLLYTRLPNGYVMLPPGTG